MQAPIAMPGMMPKKAAADTVNTQSSRDLIAAAKAGNANDVKKAFADGADATYADEEGTALWHAARKGSLVCVKAILEKGAKIDDVVLQNGPALYKAAEGGHLDVVKFLIDSKANVNGDAWGSTPLHKAAMNSHLEIVKLLLSKGAKVNAENANKVTPLHWAAAEGSVELCDTLLAAGADVNAKNANGKTPLHIASEKGHLKLIQTLLMKGADINHKNVWGDKASDVGLTWPIRDLIANHKPGMVYKDEVLSDDDDD